ncbi:MAG TPA: 30S ribosomal protein S3ae [Methanosarcinales archaeon]|nr:30S ribosomal protein S3ae [Methanosarcinales archaeon]
MVRKTTRKADRWKSKVWYQIVAPEMFGRAVIGETFADAPEKLIGRTIEVTVAEMTNDFSKQNIKLKFKVSDVSGNTANTVFMGHRLANDYIASLIKRQTSRINANFEVRTKDGYRMHIKPTCFTTHRAKTSQIEAIRKSAEELVQDRARKLDFERLIEETVQGKLSAKIYRSVKNIYPLRRVEILKTEIILPTTRQ